ncbi:MAG: hypothetical protein BGN88_05680 [Clostridiales bacterium 43-6]|nr:MAG: hypothetical protein BGN88_05680 [Clostridiales bacterium 43-6]
MNNQYLDIILAEITPVLTEKNFKKQTDEGIEYFSNGERAISVVYEEGKHLFILRQAQLTDGEGVNWTELTQWLFDNGTENDARTIGRDFNDTIKSALGVKVKDVAIPSKEVTGDHVKIDAFAGKFLVIYPQFKEEYKDNVANYGEFLYDEFFKKTAVPTLRSVLKAGNKKQIEKLIGLLNDGYLNGDSAVVTTVTYTILAGAFAGDQDLWETAEKYMEKAEYLRNSGRMILKILNNEKAKQKYMV